MNRIEFKQRMQKLKSYRDENPGKTYLDFRAYEDGGETKKHIKAPYPSFYNGRRVNPWTGQPIATGAAKPVFDLEDAANLTPVGDAITVKDMTEAVGNRDWIGLGIASLGLVPIVGSKGSKVVRNLVRGAERNVTNSMKREIPRVNKDMINRQIDKAVENMNMRKSELQNKLDSEYYISDRSDAANAVNRIIEDMDDKYYSRAAKVDKEYGTSYVDQYNTIKENYNNSRPIEIDADPYLGRERAGAKAKLDLNTDYKLDRGGDSKLPVDDSRRYEITVNPGEATAAHVNHEMSHFVDVMQAPDMRIENIEKNNLLKALSDPDQLVTYKNFEDLVKNMSPYQYFGYLNKGSEIKSFMNQTRRNLYEQGKIKHFADYVNEKTLADYMNTLQDGLSEKVVYQAFKQPKTYNKWFNAIPVVGVAGAAYINRANTDGSDLPSVPNTHL